MTIIQDVEGIHTKGEEIFDTEASGSAASAAKNMAKIRSRSEGIHSDVVGVVGVVAAPPGNREAAAAAAAAAAAIVAMQVDCELMELEIRAPSLSCQPPEDVRFRSRSDTAAVLV